MKPKYRRIAKFLPAIISIGMATTSSAALFIVDTAGNGTPAAINNGSTTIIADGGAGPQDPTPTVTIDGTINMNGDNAESGVIEVSGPNPYTINIAAGGIIAADSNQDGINASTVFTLNNSGTVSGSNTSQGIQTLGGASIITNNSGGLISGPNDAIRFTSDGGSVNNLAGGTISGLSGAASDGVQGLTDVNVTNNGTISGVNNGVRIDDNGFIYNNTNFFLGTPISGGSISGGDNGISAGNGVYVENQNLATITGTTEGIRAGEGAVISNEAGGIITGTNGIGVRVLTGSTVSNSGIITGDTGVEAGLNGIFTLNNYGTITGTGGQAINGIAGVDTINLFAGSIINGNIVLGTGDDIVIMNSDAFSSNVVNGNVRGGPDSDTLTFNGGRTSPTSTDNIIHGDVRQMENIVKNGSGVALIGGVGEFFSVESDLINITSGGLYINADVIGADGVSEATITTSGAALGGTGTWEADIFVTAGGFSAGSIPINLDTDPTNAVGGVTITGDVTHTAGSFIRHDIIPQGGGDDLIRQTGVGNTYDLGGGTNIRIASTDNNRVISDGVYTVVDSDEAILGSLGAVSIQYNGNVNGNDTGFQGSEIFNGSNVTTTVLTNFFTTAAINGTNVELTVAHDYENLPGFSENQSSIGAALDASTNSGNALIQDFIAALDNSNLAFVDGVLTDLTSLDSFSTAAAITSSNHHLNRVVQDHLAMTRSQVGTISRTYVGTYSEPAPAPEPAMGNQFNVWGSFSYDWKDSNGFNTDIDGEEASFLAGIDYRIAPSFLLGVLLQGSTADYDFSGGGSDVDSFRAAIYGTYGEATGFYADFLVGYGDHDFDSERSGFLGTYDTDTDAESLQAMLTVGYAMQSGGVKHGPFAGVEYSEVDVDGYTQGGLLPILVDDYDVESTRLLIGYRLEAQAGRFTPYLSVAYAHELDDDNQSTTGTLPGGATFGIDGGALDSAVLISAGTGYSITESLGLNVGYHGEISTGDGIDSHGGTIGLNYAF